MFFRKNENRFMKKRTVNISNYNNPMIFMGTSSREIRNVFFSDQYKRIRNAIFHTDKRTNFHGVDSITLNFLREGSSERKSTKTKPNYCDV